MSEKWWDMSDDELDDLFREASDKVDVPFDSAAYNKLRQKLGEQPMSESPKGFKKRWLFLLAGLFLMVGVGLVYRFGSDLKGNNSTEITGNVEKRNVEKPLNKPLSDNVAKLSSQPTDRKNIIEKSDFPSSVKSSTTADENLEKLAVGTTGTHSQTTAGTQTVTRNSSKTTNENLRRSSVGTIGRRTQTTAKAAKEPINGNLESSFVSTQTQNQVNTKIVDTLNAFEQVVEIKSKINNSKVYDLEPNSVLKNIIFNSKNSKNKLIVFNNSKNNKDREGKNYPPNLQNISPIFENSTTIQEQLLPEETLNKTNFYGVDFLKNKDSKFLLTDIQVKLLPYVDSLPRIIKPLKLSKFGLRLVLSPDMNSIENMGKMALGGSGGLLFEYKISKKIIVQTGIVYSSKSYVGSFDDYRNWKDWKGYHPSKPTEVDGGCKIFDIPINLRLNLFQKPKQTWFVSSGVSSYWMLNETYTYNYAWAPSRTTDWSDNSKYYFGILNFSVGMERQISKRFSLQVEPYLKTPLKYVGRGGVNLYSSGLLFSTKYCF